MGYLSLIIRDVGPLSLIEKLEYNYMPLIWSALVQQDTMYLEYVKSVTDLDRAMGVTATTLQNQGLKGVVGGHLYPGM